MTKNRRYAPTPRLAALSLALLVWPAALLAPAQAADAAYQMRSIPTEAADDEGRDGSSAQEQVVIDTMYADILGMIEAGNIRQALFSEHENSIEVVDADGRRFSSYYPAAVAPTLTVALIEAGVQLRVEPVSVVEEADVVAAEATESTSGGRAAVVIGLLSVVAFATWILRTRSSREAGRSTGKGGRNDHDEDVEGLSDTKFSDVAGCEEAIEDLREIVDFLRNAARYEELGAKVPKGALLVGPPGTGKTLLARAVAGEAGVPFYNQAGSDFVEMYVGVGAKRIREVFAKAREAGRAIIFIDEVDAIGKARQTGGERTGSNDEQEHALIALLNELDGFTTSGVIVIGATNRPEVLDPALTRPGRLERTIHVPNPDRRGREHILEVHTRNKPIADDVDLSAIASKTPGTSGAEIAAIANEAAIEAARRRLDALDRECFEAAVARVLMGRPRTSAVVTARDREITAWHEAGHALVALLEPEANDPAAVSIVPRGVAGGVTWMEGSDDQYLTRRGAMARLAVALGGRAGEERLMDGEFTQGAQSDLAHATELATAMVSQFGMTERGLTVRRGGWSGPDEETLAAVEALLTEAMDRARSILAVNYLELEALAGALLERDTLNGDEVRALVRGGRVPPRDNAKRPQALVVSDAEEVSNPKQAEGRSRRRREPVAALVRRLSRRRRQPPRPA